MRLGIDASNIRDGGGVTHLTAVLAAADPASHGISSVIVWGPRSTLDRLPSRRWLEARHESALEGSVLRRALWQRVSLPRRARGAIDLLWVPGGNAPGSFHPFVTMCRNMLPFEPAESARYGASWMRARVEILARTQARSFRRADGVIFLTEYARAHVGARVGPLAAQVVTIPHGVGEAFRLAPRPQRPLSDYSAEAPFRLVAVSIIDVYKHQDVLAEAVGRLRARGLPIALDFIGGAYPPALRRLEETLRRVDPEGRFMRYLGKVPIERLPERYHAADAFAYGSSCENLPNILLEAMASGLPIVSSDRGPMPEVLRDGGLYADPEDAEATARAIERLVSDAGLRARVAAAAFEGARAFTWTRCAAETLRFLAGVASGQRRAA